MPRTSSTITRRSDGRYEARGTFNGRRRSFFGKTADEARKKLTKALAQQDQGQTPPRERESVARYLETWLSGQKQRLRPASFRAYAIMVNKYLIPELGRFKLSRLTATQLDNAYANIRAQGLSGTSLRLMHRVLVKALGDATRRGEVLRNVATLVDAPKSDGAQMVVLTLDESRRLLAAADGDDLEALYILAATVGLRIGELLALQWRNVDLSRRRLTVVATLQKDFDGTQILAPPKTAGSRRTVSLPALVVDALQRHRTRQLENRLKVGQLYDDNDLVFATVFGKPRNAQHLRDRSFARLLKRAGLPPMKFHGLRHSAASLLLASGIPLRQVSETLGHSSPTVTLMTYAHTIAGMHDTADVMDRMFGKEAAR